MKHFQSLDTLNTAKSITFSVEISGSQYNGRVVHHFIHLDSSSCEVTQSLIGLVECV